MTQLPANFSSIPVKTPEEIEKARKELEEAKKKVEELLRKLESYAKKLEKLTLNASVGGKIKQGIVNGVVDPILNDLGCRNFELELLQLSLLINLYAINVPVLALPAIPEPLKLLLGLEVKININVPTVADFKQRVNQKIEEAKRKCQQEAINKQLRDAAEEEIPFFARQAAQNLLNQQNLARPLNSNESNCVITETGETLEEARDKGAFILTRVLKCCGRAQVQVLNSRQENGTFIVTVGIL